MFRDKPQYASMVPFHDITRDRAEQRRLFAETGEMADRLVGQRRRLFARPRDPHQGDEGRLARGSILVQRLARQRLVAFAVKYVVRSEEPPSDLQSLTRISYAVF